MPGFLMEIVAFEVLVVEIGLVATAVVETVALAVAVGLFWVWAKTRPAPRTSIGVARAIMRITFLLFGFGGVASASAIWNHSGLEISGVMVFPLLLSRWPKTNWTNWEDSENATQSC